MKTDQEDNIRKPKDDNLPPFHLGVFIFTFTIKFEAAIWLINAYLITFFPAFF